MADMISSSRSALALLAKGLTKRHALSICVHVEARLRQVPTLALRRRELTVLAVPCEGQNRIRRARDGRAAQRFVPIRATGFLRMVRQDERAAGFAGHRDDRAGGVRDLGIRVSVADAGQVSEERIDDHHPKAEAGDGLGQPVTGFVGPCAEAGVHLVIPGRADR